MDRLLIPRVAFSWYGAALLGSGILIGLAGLHWLIHFQPSFGVLYVVPIWISTRLGGRAAGLVLVSATTLVMLALQIWGGTAPMQAAIDSIIRFSAFGAVMFLIVQFEAALHEQQNLAVRDSLTGLLNRRALHEMGPDSVRSAIQLNRPLTVMVLDCDGLKQVNDRYGHAAGDHVLQLLAKVLTEATRGSDLAARSGGDEFVLLLFNVSKPEAATVVRRVEKSFTGAVRDAGYVASVSIGLAQLDERLTDFHALVRHADEAMYARKKRRKTSAYLR